MPSPATPCPRPRHRAPALASVNHASSAVNVARPPHPQRPHPPFAPRSVSCPIVGASSPARQRPVSRRSPVKLPSLLFPRLTSKHAPAPPPPSTRHRPPRRLRPMSGPTPARAPPSSAWRQRSLGRTSWPRSDYPMFLVSETTNL
jgi:hypothetical protein